MSKYLEFRNARCKDCYKCLRECPVKAIDFKGHQAEIIEDRCILCGHCTLTCPQNAKIVHSELEEVKQMLAGTDKVIASVAPSFISSFGLTDFGVMKLALAKLGFADAEETAVGAQAVTKEYARLLKTGEFTNFITSACPAACRMIQEYYPKALKYLAPVDSPMVAHAKIIKKQHPDARIVFIGPCIAKKREADECHLIDHVLTFEDVVKFFDERNIKLDEISNLSLNKKNGTPNLAKEYPIPQGIINSFPVLPEGYEYIAVDGPKKCVEALENIEHLDHVVMEINLCVDACVNGPCSLVKEGGSIKATADVRKYVSREKQALTGPQDDSPLDLSLAAAHPRLRSHSMAAPEREIEAILHQTGKMKPEDELNCGSCGYATCREKAWAVYNLGPFTTAMLTSKSACHTCANAPSRSHSRLSKTVPKASSSLIRSSTFRKSTIKAGNSSASTTPTPREGLLPTSSAPSTSTTLIRKRSTSAANRRTSLPRENTLIYPSTIWLDKTSSSAS